jgi:hypothetical protein
MKRCYIIQFQWLLNLIVILKLQQLKPLMQRQRLQLLLHILPLPRILPLQQRIGHRRAPICSHLYLSIPNSRILIQSNILHAHFLHNILPLFNFILNVERIAYFLRGFGV